MNVFVAGAGYVGLELCRQLAAAGHRVWAARRQPPPLPEGVTPWPCDLTDPALVVPEGVTHLAFTASPDSSDPGSYERTYVTALERTLEAFDRAAARGGTRLERVLLVSSTSVFAASPSPSASDDVALVDESSPVRTDGTAAHIVAGESRVIARGGVVLRLAGIYGPTRTRMIRMVRDGSARISSDRPIGNRIHRDDCAGAIAHLLAHPAPEPVYVGVDHAPVELGPPPHRVRAHDEHQRIEARRGRELLHAAGSHGEELSAPQRVPDEVDHVCPSTSRREEHDVEVGALGAGQVPRPPRVQRAQREHLDRQGPLRRERDRLDDAGRAHRTTVAAFALPRQGAISHAAGASQWPTPRRGAPRGCAPRRRCGCRSS